MGKQTTMKDLSFSCHLLHLLLLLPPAPADRRVGEYFFKFFFYNNCFRYSVTGFPPQPFSVGGTAEHVPGNGFPSECSLLWRCILYILCVKFGLHLSVNVYIRVYIYIC